MKTRHKNGKCARVKKKDLRWFLFLRTPIEKKFFFWQIKGWLNFLEISSTMDTRNGTSFFSSLFGSWKIILFSRAHMFENYHKKIKSQKFLVDSQKVSFLVVFNLLPFSRSSASSTTKRKYAKRENATAGRQLKPWKRSNFTSPNTLRRQASMSSCLQNRTEKSPSSLWFQALFWGTFVDVWVYWIRLLIIIMLMTEKWESLWFMLQTYLMTHWKISREWRFHLIYSSSYFLRRFFIIKWKEEN